MYTRPTKQRARTNIERAGLTTLLAAVAMLSQPAAAAPTQRYVTDDHGDFIQFGNTVGFDCRDGKVEKPVVGSVPMGLLDVFSCGGALPDTDNGVDILWRSDYPGTNQATASTLLDPQSGRSTAVLALPAGAQVLMARLYWAAQRTAGQGAGTTVQFERPGALSKTVTAQAGTSKVIRVSNLDYYQSSADVTKEVQALGNGAYRVGNIQTIDVRAQTLDVAFVAWNIVVFYHLDSAPIRNLALFDGLERISSGGSSTTTVNLSGFSVPNNGFGAKLGIIAYEGDNDITGDQLQVNGTAVSNGYNPVNNFFNRTSTVLDQLAPRTGDLPQMSGRPSSMAGYDSDVIDITARLSPGDKQVALTATSSGDEYYLGVFATAVSTIRPVFASTQKTVTNLTRSDGRYLPGDTLEYLISTRNTGNDTGKLVTVTDTLPAGMTYVSGSIVITSGANMGTKTDATDADQAEYDAATRTVRARLGTGATGTMGGDLAMDAVSAVRFRVTLDANAQGTIYNQATLSALGQTAQMEGITTPSTWVSGDGTSLQTPTGVVITTCNTNADCSGATPICDTTATPRRCVCRMDSDCAPGLYCNPSTQACVECVPGSSGQCSASGPGSVCLASARCGCNTGADCNGRACDPVTMACDAVATDLSLTLTRQPVGGLVAPGSALTYVLTVKNNGSTSVPGAQLNAALTPMLANAMWTCVGQGGAVCPAASGSAPIQTAVTLPAGGQLIYTIRGGADANSSGAQDFIGTLQPPNGYRDTNPADNTVTDSVLLGVPPMGPDLSISVREDVSTDSPAVTYTIDVKNHGPGPADGATVVYDVPSDTTVDIQAGDGWQCALSADARQVICTRTQPIPEGTAPPIRIRVTTPNERRDVPLHVTASASDASGAPLTDPNPADNTVNRTTELTQFALRGGGLMACHYASAASGPAGLGMPAAFTLLALVGLTRGLRRTRRSPQTTRNN